METAHTFNLMDVDEMVQQFLQHHRSGIASIHQMYFKSNNEVSFQALLELLKDELRTGCVSFINKNSPLEELSSYLFYIVNAFCRKTATPKTKRKSEHICPGCLFLGMATLVFFNKTFQCEECAEQLKVATDPKQIAFYKTFAIHNKQGYRCPDCKRFIPHPLDNTHTISCPYFDCCFVGEYSELNSMHHTTSQTNPEKLVLDLTQDGNRFFKDNIVSNEIGALQILQMKEDILSKFNTIKEVIDSQINQISYTGSDFTIKHKQSVYEAFNLLLDKYPEEMVGYLLEDTRSGGFQHKVFQEYIRLLEASFPFFIKKGRKRYLIDNLLSEHLCLFDGISVFDAIVTDKLVIKNGTKEFYIGGRKASYTKPYYIGKLLNVIHAETKVPLLPLVKEYSFSRIKLQEVEPGTPVIVTHLRVPPHYQMGGMVYVNRVRKKIIERVHSLMKREINE